MEEFEKKINEFLSSVSEEELLQELIECGLEIEEEKKMSKIYKGYELVKAIAEGEIKERYKNKSYF